MNDLISTTEQTMSSVEIVALINNLREDSQAELRHDNFMSKVFKVLGETVALNFQGYYVAENGKKNPCYNLPRREASLMVMSESYKIQAAVYDRWQELEVKKPMSALQMISAMALEQDAANQRITSLESSVARLTGESKCMAILAWATLNGLTIPVSKAAAMGKQASSYCRTMNIETGTVKDERYGKINTYPESVLDRLFNIGD
jgi:phage regulator Rha-like protein